MKKSDLSRIVRLGGFMAALIFMAVQGVAELKITLDEALTLARDHNWDLRAARARFEQSASDVQQAWAALLPRVVVQGKYTHNYKAVTFDIATELSQFMPGLAGVIGSTAPIEIQKKEQLDAGINLTVPLIVPYAYSALAAARKVHLANAANFSITEADVLMTVAQTFYAAAGGDELLLTRKDAVAVALETLENSKARFQAGTVAQVDVMRAEVAVVRAKQDETEAEDTRAQVYRALATLLGTREPLRVIPTTIAAVEPASDKTLVDNAFRLRPEFVFYQNTIDSASLAIRSFSWQWAPMLSAFGNAQTFNYQSFSGDKYSWAVGLQLDWTLYDGGSRDAERRRAMAQRHEFEARLQLLRDTVADGVINARGTFDTKRCAVDSAVRSLELSREALRLVRVQYTFGKATQLDLLQAQDSLVSAEVEVAQSRFQLALADLQLKRETGDFPFRRSQP